MRSPHGREAAPERGPARRPHARARTRAATTDATVEKNNQERKQGWCPRPLNPARLKQMKAEASAEATSPASRPARTPTRRSAFKEMIGKKPDANTETLVQQPRHGSREHRRSRDISYAASEIYEPDWALSPFPSNIVGTFSCHGIEPSYFTDGAMAKINQIACVCSPLRRRFLTGVVRRV